MQAVGAVQQQRGCKHRHVGSGHQQLQGILRPVYTTCSGEISGNPPNNIAIQRSGRRSASPSPSRLMSGRVTTSSVSRSKSG